MFYVREFEFYESEGFVIAAPFDLGAGTFGDNMQDALEYAADYLFTYITDCLINDKKIPEATYGNKPGHRGTVIAVSVDCDLSKVESVSAAEAARILGVSRARVSQMCESGLLESWKDGTRRLITRNSVNARLTDKPKAGRPRKKIIAAAL